MTHKLSNASSHWIRIRVAGCSGAGVAPSKSSAGGSGDGAIAVAPVASTVVDGVGTDAVLLLVPVSPGLPVMPMFSARTKPLAEAPRTAATPLRKAAEAAKQVRGRCPGPRQSTS
jgi:hypothetical protein